MKTRILVGFSAVLLIAGACKPKDPKRDDKDESPDDGKPKVVRSEVVLGDDVVFAPDGDVVSVTFALSAAHIGILVRRDQGGSSAYIKPKAGGEAKLLGEGVMAIAADKEHIYYSLSGAETALLRVASPDAAPQKLTAEAPALFAVGEGRVFWPAHRAVRGVAAEGGLVSTVAESKGSVTALTVADGFLYWLSVGPVASGVTRSEHVGWIERMPVAGGEVATVVEEIPNPGRALQAGAGSVYYLSGSRVGPKALMNAPAGGGSPAKKVTGWVVAFEMSVRGLVAGMPVRGVWGVYSVPDESGTPQKIGKLAHGQVTQVGADAEHVYFVHSGIIYRAEK